MAETARKKILIVDDDAMMRELLKGILRQDEYHVVGEAGNGEQGLAMVERFEPDVVCLDIHMPKMDGMQCLEALHATKPECKVLMISADATLPLVQEALTKGASGYIVKPFKAGKVLDTLQRCLGT